MANPLRDSWRRVVPAWARINGWGIAELPGGMDLGKRDRAVVQVRTDPDHLMLISSFDLEIEPVRATALVAGFLLEYAGFQLGAAHGVPATGSTRFVFSMALTLDASYPKDLLFDVLTETTDVWHQTEAAMVVTAATPT